MQVRKHQLPEKRFLKETETPQAKISITGKSIIQVIEPTITAVVIENRAITESRLILQ